MPFDRKAYIREWKRKEYHRKKDEMRARSKKWREANKERVKRKQKEWSEKNRDRQKKYREEYRRKNATKFKEYDRNKYLRNLQKQDELAARPRPDKCEFCERKGKVVWDHDHHTNTWRSWPCRKCNTVMGLVDDNPNTLRKLADAIERHQAEHRDKIQLQTSPNST